MGVTFAEVSPDICFRLNPRCHCGAVFIAAAGFAIVTLVVCMLAAWEWGQFSGFTSTSQRSGWRCCAAFCWR
jgi:phosphatidate cytidylyltransferase